MQILELAAQGVRGFSPSSRAELRAGYCILIPPSKEPVPLSLLLIALLYPDGRGSERSLLAAGCDLGNASLMFRAKDGQAYYLARELGGVSALHRANESSGNWELLADETSAISQYLRSTVGLPSSRHFHQAFTLVPSNFPSRRQKTKGTHVEPTAPIASAPTAPDAAAAKSKFAELTKELQLSAEVERWQLKLDEIISEQSEVDNQLGRAAQLESALKEAQTAYASAPSAESLSLPSDIADRAKRFAQLVSKRDEALAKLDSDSGAELDPAFVEPLKQNGRFWMAAALGAAFFVGGLFLHGPARYVSLLDIPAFGFAALLAVRYVDDVQRSEARSRKGERRVAREKKISGHFEAEAQWVKKAMAALKLDSPNDIAEALGRKAELKRRVEELRAQVSAVHQDREYAAAVAKRARLAQERQTLEAKMEERGGYVRTPTEIQRELNRLKASNAGAEGSTAAVPPPASSSGGGLASSEDPFPSLLALASELLMVDAATAAKLIRDRATTYFTALTDRRYSGVEIDRTGTACVLARGEKVQTRDLPAKDLDLLYLSARLALVAQEASRALMPLIVQDLGVLLDTGTLILLGGILKQLGAATQVLHLCSDRALQSMADSTASL